MAILARWITFVLLGRNSRCYENRRHKVDTVRPLTYFSLMCVTLNWCPIILNFLNAEAAGSTPALPEPEEGHPVVEESAQQRPPEASLDDQHVGQHIPACRLALLIPGRPIGPPAVPADPDPVDKQAHGPNLAVVAVTNLPVPIVPDHPLDHKTNHRLPVPGPAAGAPPQRQPGRPNAHHHADLRAGGLAGVPGHHCIHVHSGLPSA